MARKANRANIIEKELKKLKAKEDKLIEQLRVVKEQAKELEDEYKKLQAINVISLIDKYHLNIDEVELLIMQEIEKQSVEHSTGKGDEESNEEDIVDNR
ncbi:hypothetical protein NHG25_04550 [Aerococcaceae bacterium NML191292]|nr:hypothetical protein [Aerococcaceae bacterium NML191292]MCW6675455.1 hypothetical protein [Aerococcaceae bacterium NML171108]